MSKKRLLMLVIVLVTALTIGAVQSAFAGITCQCFDEGAAEALCETECQFERGVGCGAIGFVLSSYCNGNNCVSTFEFWCDDYTYHQAQVSKLCGYCQ